MVPKYLELIDTNTEGPRYDVTPLFGQIQAFRELVSDLSQPFVHRSVDLVAGIDALGFILGTALALHLQKGFIPIRKGGKIPGRVLQASFTDYTQQEKWLEIRADAVNPGARVLLVDEWIETGAQVKAAAKLVESEGGTIIGIATINMDENQNTHALRKQYYCHTITNNL